VENVPIAKQLVNDGQETCSSSSPVKLGDPGMVWIDQRLPFQRSTSAPSTHRSGEYWQPSPTSTYPTAVQALADLHDSPVSAVADQSLRVAICVPSHRPPFQTSATADVTVCSLPKSWRKPTAVHASAERAEIALGGTRLRRPHEPVPELPKSPFVSSAHNHAGINRKARDRLNPTAEI
jgi:hypothetical protein